jgi:hypothetical protein
MDYVFVRYGVGQLLGADDIDFMVLSGDTRSADRRLSQLPKALGSGQGQPCLSRQRRQRDVLGKPRCRPAQGGAERVTGLPER